MCNEMNADVPPLLAAEAAPAPLLLLRIHLDILEKLPRIETSRRYPPAVPGQSRIPGIPVQSLNFPESAPIPAGIPDPWVPDASQH
jgi:hypothetical protein